LEGWVRIAKDFDPPVPKAIRAFDGRS